MSSGQEEEVRCGGWHDVFFHEQSLLEVRGERDGKRCLMGFWIAKVAGVYADGAKGIGVGIAGRGIEGRGCIAGCDHGVIAFKGVQDTHCRIWDRVDIIWFIPSIESA